MLDHDGTRFGIAVAQMFPRGTPVDLELVREHLRTCEALGYESAWVQDQTVGTMQTLDPLTLLAYAATVTERMRLGVSVLVLPLRNPLNLAKTAATLDRLSGGRLIVGVGVGGGVARYPAFGLSPEGRAARFEESLEILRRLWRDPEVDFEGRFFRLEGVASEPKPVQSPLPVWFGAHVEPALRRAVRMGDGWMGAGASSSADFKRAIAAVRRYLDESGRDRASFPLSKRVYIAVDADKRAAREKLRAWFDHYYGDAEMAERVSLFGSEQAIADGLGALLDERPHMLMLNPVYDVLEQAERLARDVVPKL